MAANPPLAPRSWGSGGDRISSESYVRCWISHMKEDGELGYREVPPIDIIFFPELMNEAWDSKRLVPWRQDSVKWEEYIEYICGFFEKQCDHPTLHSALERCLEMEEKYLASPAKEWGAVSLSKAIKERCDLMKEIDDVALSLGDSAVVAAAFMCIAQEALLMSELDKSVDYLATFSDDVRQHAFNLMGYKGSQYKVVCGALLGMMKEAEVMRKCFSEGGPYWDEVIETCGLVREHTLGVFIIFEKLFAAQISGGNPIKVASTGQTSVQVVVKRGEETDDTSITKNKTKAKAYIQSLLKKAKRGKLFSSRKSEPKK